MGFEHLMSPAPPWVELVLTPKREVLASVLERCKNILTVPIEGTQCKTKLELLSAIAFELKFPSYFGGNWDAFEECINDLEWLRYNGYLLVIFDAEHILVGQEADYKTFVDIIQKAGSKWATSQSTSNAPAGVPFHLLLAIRDENEVRKRDWRVPLVLLAEP